MPSWREDWWQNSWPRPHDRWRRCQSRQIRRERPAQRARPAPEFWIRAAELPARLPRACPQPPETSKRLAVPAVSREPHHSTKALPAYLYACKLPPSKKLPDRAWNQAFASLQLDVVNSLV